MNDILFFLYSLVSVFLIISPFSAVMTFVAFTNSKETGEKNRVASLAVFASGSLALLFASSGSIVLDILNISLDILRIVCGVLLLSVIYDALKIDDVLFGNADMDSSGHYRTGPIWLFPLAVPLLTGPGVIATVLTLSAEASSLNHKFMLIAAVTSAFAITLLVFKFSNVIGRWINRRRMYIFSRVLAVLLLALSLNMVITGLNGTFDLDIQFLDNISEYLSI